MSALPATPENDAAIRAEGARRIVFVVGSGRSGTSTLAGALKRLGAHIPQPEVPSDETNPRGFSEPAWVIAFHDRLLKRANVQVSDARPRAWFATGRLAMDEGLINELSVWLEEQFQAGGNELVIKDPRLVWFLGLWRAAAERCGATPLHATMLRPVTEVVASKQKYYDDEFGVLNRAAAWLNMMLHTERATRGSERAFVQYHDLLEDWTVPVSALGERFALDSVRNASANDIREVHHFIDAGLRRHQHTWDDLPVPERLRLLAQAASEELDALTAPEADTADRHARLDDLRARYSEYYLESEAIAQSTAVAHRRQVRFDFEAKGMFLDPPPEERNALGDRVAGRTPHGLRAIVPGPVRRSLKRRMNRRAGR
jgi:hypothetical protein